MPSKKSSSFIETFKVPINDPSSRFDADFRSRQALARSVGDCTFICTGKVVDEEEGIVTYTFSGEKSPPYPFKAQKRPKR